MKKVLVLILISSVFLVSCIGNNQVKIEKKLNKTLDKYIGYKTELELNILGKEKKSIYRLQENYINENNIEMEILEPKENNKISIKYVDDNIYMKNASINESISLKETKYIDKGLLFGEIFTNRDNIISIKKEKLGNQNYYIIECNLKNPNRYNNKKKIYFNNKNFIPEKILIIDKDNKERLTIKYDKFKYIKK